MLLQHAGQPARLTCGDTMINEHEQDLISRFRATGQAGLFARLIKPYDWQMHSLARSILRHDADANDAVQDAVIRAYQNIDSLADTTRFAGWLMRIVFGCSIDALRHREAGIDKHRALLLDDPAGSTALPGDRLDAQEWLKRISHAIQSLPERYRQPLLLFHLDGLSSKQVAEHLSLPEGTVRSLLTRARQRLNDSIPNDLTEIPALANEVFIERASAEKLLGQNSGKCLHVMNGDAAAHRLRAGGLQDAMVVWTDLLHEGPTPIDVSPQAWRALRADYLASLGFSHSQSIQERMASADSELASPGDGRERVFWFEHDLYDQLLLIRHLHWLSQHDAECLTKLSLICIGDFPGIPRFIGLGQLEPDQIASLWDTRQPITRKQIELGSQVWSDFCNDDPAGLVGWLGKDTAALPYLKAAIIRHLQQYPSIYNGLGLTEQLILQSVAEQSKSAGAIFAEHQSAEVDPFLGDAVVYHYIHRLTTEARPSLTVMHDGASVTSKTEVSLTDFGRRLLAGKADRVHANGLTRWFGGVQVQGNGPMWRWDEDSQQTVMR